MKGLLKYPAFNAVCIALFSAFYGVIFIFTATSGEYESVLYYLQPNISASPFWLAWSRFLAAGGHGFIAIALLAATLLLVVLLLLRRRPYDEYHTDALSQCLAIAVILMIAAVAVLYLSILRDPNGIVEKFTLFIVIHWGTVVFADYAFVFMCRWR
jgi:hypothetical protein